MAIVKPANDGYSYRTGTCNGTNGKKYDFWLEYKVLEQFPVTRESKVDTKLYLQRNDGVSASAFNNYETNYRKINDYGFNGNIDTRNNARVLLAEKEWTIKHEEDGKKIFNVDALFYIDAVGLTSGTLNTNIELPLIQVASTIEFSDYILGTEFNATIKSSNPNFTHNLKFYVLDQEVARRNNIPSKLVMKFTDEEETTIYNLMANVDKTDFKIVVDTINNGETIGSTETIKKISLNTDINKPELLNATFYVNDNLSYLGTANIKGRSNITFDAVTFKSKNGATMSKLRLEMGSKKVEKNYNGDGTDDVNDPNIITLVSPEEDVTSVILTGIDSRGLETRISRNVEISPYLPPKILKMETYRKDGVSVETYLNLEISCWLGSTYGLVTEVLYFGYSTTVDLFNKTTEFKNNYEYDPNTNILKLTDFPVHLNGINNGFPAGEESHIDLLVSLGIPSSSTGGSTITLWNIPLGDGRVKITDGYVAESMYKDIDGYKKGYNGITTGTHDHEFFGTMALNGVEITPGGGGEHIGQTSIWQGLREKIPGTHMTCEGQWLSKTEYPVLYDRLGGTYGETETMFRLPNNPGRVIVHLDTGQVVFNTLGKVGGDTRLQKHSHPITLSGAPSIENNVVMNSWGWATTGQYFAGGTIRESGEGNAGNLQPYIVGYYIIKVREEPYSEDLYNLDIAVENLKNVDFNELSVGSGITLTDKVFVKDGLGNIYIQGNATINSGSFVAGYTMLFTLPVNVRPPHNIFIPCITSSGLFAFIRILPNGEVAGFMSTTGQTTFHFNVMYKKR